MVLKTPSEKLAALRAELAKLGVDGFIVPHTDEFMSEYMQPSEEALAWLTDFTGSAGFAAILPDQAAVLTDSRYEIQVRKQVDQDLYEMVDTGKAGVSDWFAVRGTAGQVIGYDPKLHTSKQIKTLLDKLTPAGLTIKALDVNPLNSLWQDRPVEPVLPAEIFPEAIAGVSSATKRTEIAAALRDKGVKSTVISMADSIAWLLNIRGQDIPHNPVVLSYAIIHAQDAVVDWYVDDRKLTPDVRAHLGNAIRISPLSDLPAALKKLAGPVGVDFERTSQWFVEELRAAGTEVRDVMDPCVQPKAIKNSAEQAAIRAAHIRDGVALTKLIYWFEHTAQSGNLTELDVEAKLIELRQQQSGFRGTSFDTIAGWADHGAIVHYRATPATNKRIVGDGLLLLDSGAQYNDGTTDVTRTLLVGTPTAEMKDRYTRVLKGHIDLGAARFPEGTTGMQIDVFARKPLWDIGLDFGHGTGHGVGCFLYVHEESLRISPRVAMAVKPGVLVSNEPGYYKEGEYGIRLENLILSYDTGDTFADDRKIFAFETVTLAPFDMRLINLEMLTAEQRTWLNAYHTRVYKTLAEYLEPDEQNWLKTHIFQ